MHKMAKLDLTIIILTFNEELHIKRCLENISDLAEKIYIIDCFSTDRTKEICAEFDNVEIVEHQWPGNQAAQFNWALDSLEIRTEWILRLDADEYLLPDLKEEIYRKLPTIPQDVTGIELKRRHIFMGRWVKHGVYPVVLLRLFRKGFGRYDNRIMDEHIVLSRGRCLVLDNDFCDHSLVSISDYCKKHIGYAQREALAVRCEQSVVPDHILQHDGHGKQAQEKHKKKKTYNKQPLFWRSFAYFIYRYILKGGFLDGKEGFLFAFLQGWWYRTLVDANIYESEIDHRNNKDHPQLR